MKEKTSLFEVSEMKLNKQLDGISSLIGLKAAETEKYEKKFNEFWATTRNPKRIDYKVYGGMETYQPGYKN